MKKKKERLKISVPDQARLAQKEAAGHAVGSSLESEGLRNLFFPRSQEDKSGSAYSGVGPYLREARIAAGYSLEDIVRALNIRLVYIEALEEGRYTDLPGVTYASGFLRSYAKYLKLDYQKILRDFRAEISHLDQPTDLHFPEPSAKSQVPAGAVILVSLVIAGCIYAGWRQWSPLWQDARDTKSALSSVVSLPVSDSASPGQGSEDKGANLALVTPSEESMITRAREEYRSTRQANMVLDSPPSEPQQSPEPEAEEQDSGPLSSLPSEEFSDSAQSSDRFEPSTPLGVEGVAAEDADLYWNSSLGRFMPRMPAQSANGLGQDTTDESVLLPSGPRIYGESNSEGRILIEAIEESWVQVQEDDGSLILTRILYPGDQFYAPDRPGLKLTTGNAGGLKLIIDEQVVLPIGLPGAVRRDVILDPDRLLSDRETRQSIGFQPLPELVSEENVSGRFEEEQTPLIADEDSPVPN